MKEDTGEGSAVRAGALRLSIAVRNAMLAEALAAAAVRVGWAPVPTRCADAVLVTDQLPADKECAPVVLVCEPTAFGARTALDAVSRLRVSGIVCADEPGDVGRALDGLERGQAAVPLRVMALAAEMPVLTVRQTEVLTAIVDGCSNVEIGRRLLVSQATVKRELSVLYSTFHAASRPALVAAALVLGLAPRFS